MEAAAAARGESALAEERLQRRKDCAHKRRRVEEDVADGHVRVVVVRDLHHLDHPVRRLGREEHSGERSVAEVVHEDERGGLLEALGHVEVADALGEGG